MKRLAYYLQAPLIPVIYLVVFVQQLVKAFKSAHTNAMHLTVMSWESHKRFYK